jgi:predicted dehydrogenase
MLRGSVIGFGRMGITHYSILNTHSNVDFVAVCDASNFMLKFLQQFSKIQTFTDYRKMFDKVDLDFVIVCTPTASHAEIGLAAAERGIHVFLEKPFALDIHQGEELVDAMQQKELVNQVGYFLRFHSIFNKVKELISEGAIGEISHYKNEMYGRTVLKPSKSSWRAEKKMGGGCMMDFGSHCLDLSDYLFGPVSSVKGSIMHSIFSAEVEDAVMTHLVHESNVPGTVFLNWSDASYRRPYNRIEIVGKKGKIIADRQEYRIYQRDKGWSVGYLPEIDKGERFIVRGPEFTKQLNHFIDCIEKSETNSIGTFADAFRTDKVMEMIKESAL